MVSYGDKEIARFARLSDVAGEYYECLS
jgi:hypothetical protein